MFNVCKVTNCFCNNSHKKRFLFTRNAFSLRFGMLFLIFLCKFARMIEKKKIGEMARFAVVGVLATAIHYAIYWFLQRLINENVAYTIGYLISFIANYFLSARFTFKEKTTAGNGIGFAGAHLCNYLLQMGLLNLFLWMGISKEWAPLPVYCIAVPVNFLLVRFVFKHLKARKS